MSQLFNDLKRQHVIDQLRKHGYTDIQGKSYEELKAKLAYYRYLEIDVSADANKWF